MKKLSLVLGFLLLTFFAFSQNIPRRNCNDCWNRDSLGNHRVVVEFNGTGNDAAVNIEWRRRDLHPDLKKIIVEDAKTHRQILNVKTGLITREKGEIYFEPVSGKGMYYLYYMPYKNAASKNYPQSVYLKPENTASSEWLHEVVKNKKPSKAVVKEIQSINELNSYDPMEIIATKKETASLIQKHAKDAFLVFPENRLYSIRMKNDLPKRWIEKGIKSSFSDTALRGENFAYQLGVYALEDLQNVSVRFSDLNAGTGKVIPSKDMTCLNTTGIYYTGQPMAKKVDIKKGEVQPMWCLINIPENVPSGKYSGKIYVTTDPITLPKEISINLVVKNEVAKDHGVNEPWKMTRLTWLNSTMAQENTVIAPYTPLKVAGNTIDLLGRRVTLDEDGLPKQIQTFFTPEMTGYQAEANNLLTEGIHFHFTQPDSKNITLKKQGINYTIQKPGTVEWKATSTSDVLKMEVEGSLEFDGFLSYQIKVTALQDVDFKNISMHIPFEKKEAKYIMGLGLKGEQRPDSVLWKWDVAHKNQDGAWIGNVNAGLHFSLRDQNYMRPLNTNFYLQKPLILPTSWGNDNKGGINIFQKGTAVLCDNYTGPRSMKKGDVLYFNVNFLITPFHPLNTDFQWATRFYHAYKPIDTVKETGATIINIHHGNAINPYINYPFIAWKAMKAYIDSAHAAGIKVKIYNTIRELSDHCYETFALRSLGHEIYSSGKGGGYSWLQEHIGDDYIAGWFVPEMKDAAIINSGMNRWHNYYVEGMNWLTQNVGIDGIYLDDVAFDRVTMKRIKRVLTRDGHPGIIDLHSANQYDKADGWNNSANLYMEHFPYLNRLWFGEYFDYEHNSPDFFLTEVSGIPFGLMGEMLQGGGNPWRGMIYGMTNRLPWSDNADPRPIWKLWDEFGMQGTSMIGYWSESCPVKTDNKNVLATVYKKKGKALVSIASWADTDVKVKLLIDWKSLGIDSSKAIITAPYVKNFQPEKSFQTGDKIPVEKAQGWLLIIEEK